MHRQPLDGFADRAIRAAGARLLHLRAGLNPIEQFFDKFKHWLRKAAQRTTEAVCANIAPILETVSPNKCANRFANTGYGPSSGRPRRCTESSGKQWRARLRLHMSGRYQRTNRL